MLLISKSNSKLSFKSYEVIKNILSNSKRNKIDDVKVQTCDMIRYLVATKEIIVGSSKWFHKG